MTTSNETIKKPMALRVIFILNALMTILPFVFYLVVTSKGIELGGLDPMLMVYTGIAYIVSFAALVYCIINRKLLGARIIFVLNILIALPASAYIGILVAIISSLLSVYNKKVLAYFNA